MFLHLDTSSAKSSLSIIGHLLSLFSHLAVIHQLNLNVRGGGYVQTREAREANE